MAFKTLNNTFTDLAVTARLEYVNSFLKEIDSIIDFNALRPILKKNGIGTKNVCGVKAYDSVLMFKILLIQKFYDLSDEKAEEGLNVNLLYLHFVGLSLEDKAPDSTTIGRFRNSLIKNKIHDALFSAINKQLEDKGFIVSGGKDVLIDATLTKSDNNTIKSKNKEQKSEHRKKVEADNKAIDVLIEEELHKEKPSAKKISKLLKKKANLIITLFGESAGSNDTKNTKITRAIFRDTFITKESRKLYLQDKISLSEEKAENTIDRVKITANPRFIERIPAGVEFDFEMVLRKFSEDEALPLDKTIRLGLLLLQNDALGGGGSRGNGKIEFGTFSKITDIEDEINKSINEIEQDLQRA